MQQLSALGQNRCVIGGILTIPYRIVRRKRGTITVLAGCLLLAAGQARGRELSAIDFSLRLPAALAEFSTYSDVAALGGASAGSQYQSSVNPAATDWQPAAPYTVGLSPQYQAILFERGPLVNVAFEAATLKLPEGEACNPPRCR